jgi:hypothetical protein
MPSDVKGNISCVTNPEKNVLGYVPVSFRATKRAFIWGNAGIYQPEPSTCTTEKYWVDSGWTIYRIIVDEKLIGNEPTYAPIRCVDCTANGGSKNKPSWWPNTLPN